MSTEMHAVGVADGLLQRAQRALRTEGLEIAAILKRGKWRMVVRQRPAYEQRGELPADFVPSFLRYGQHGYEVVKE